MPERLPAMLGRIEFRDVSFAYDASEPVLQHVNLRILAGVHRAAQAFYILFLVVLLHR